MSIDFALRIGMYVGIVITVLTLKPVLSRTRSWRFHRNVIARTSWEPAVLIGYMGAWFIIVVVASMFCAGAVFWLLHR